MRRRDFLTTSAAAAGLLLGSGARGAAGDGTGSTLLVEGHVVTLDPTRPRAEALWLRDGLVQGVGTASELRALAGRDAREIDLAGRTVIPGLNDCHLHPTRGARYWARELRWDGVSTLARALERVREQAARTPPGEWVRVVGGWSRDQFEERRLPTPAELTAASPEVPVFVLYLYSRGFLNAAGVRAMDWQDGDVDVPPGVRYEPTEDGGAVLHAEPGSGLINRVLGALPPPDPAEEAVSAHHFYRELARVGLTSASDMAGGGHVFPNDYASSRTLASSGAATIRISNYVPPLPIDTPVRSVETLVAERAANEELVANFPEGFVLEGVGEALTLAVYDLENFMAERPALPSSDAWATEFERVVRELLRARWPLRVHATYDETIRAMLDVFERADAAERAEGRAGFRGVRWAFEHAETVSPESLARIGALGGGIAIQGRMAYAGEVFAERYGAKAAAEAPPIADIVAAGLPLGLGTDGTRVASYNPWPVIDWVTTGRTVGGTVQLAERHRRTREQALALYTVGSAWFSGEEARKGRLAPGQFADLAVLDRDPLAVSDDELADTQSVLTMLGGRVTHGAEAFAELAPALPPVRPSWSPLVEFDGYDRSGR